MSEIGSGGGTSYPTAIDTDTNLEVDSPNAGKTLIRAATPNDLAAGMVSVQTTLGTNPQGSKSDVKTFLQVDHNTDGTEKISKRYALDTGVADAYAIAPQPPISAYAVGQMFSFLAVHANTTASTLAVSSLVAVAMKKHHDHALVAGDIEAGAIVTVVYDGTFFQMISQPSAIQLGTLSAQILNSGYPQSGTGGETLRFIRGIIKGSNGSILQGAGFTSARVSAGLYTITFTTPFSSVPAITATLISGDTSFISGTPLAGSASIFIYNISIVGIDDDFNFIAIGAA